MVRCFASVVCVGLIAIAVVGVDLKSGPAVGAAVPAFNPRNVTGPDAGTRAAPVVRHGPNPVVAVFARDLSPGLTTLAKKLDEAVATHRDARLGSFVVMLSDDDKLEAKLREWAEKDKLKQVALAIDAPAGPKGYDIGTDADVTVVLYARRKCVRTFAFEKAKLADKDVAAVIAAVKEILPDEKK